MCKKFNIRIIFIVNRASCHLNSVFSRDLYLDGHAFLMSTDINAPIVAVDLSDYGCLRKNEGKVIRRMPIEGFRRLSDCLRIRRWIEQGAADNLCF